MRRHKLVIGKKRAQAMVEFALALPILLLLLYGILEAGRLLFIYSSIVTASRQAVRYGSTTGMGLDYTPDGGPNNTTYQRYRDCYGIRRAAQRADFLNSFEDSDIRIFYDDGPTTPPSDTGENEQEICSGGAVNWPAYNVDNGTRLVVKINGDFLPLVPGLVPFIRRSADDTPPDPIRGVSARTILVSVSIYVTAPPSTWVPLFTSTATSLAATATDVPPTATDVPPTATDVPPTATSTNIPDTPGGPTATATDVPPTSTSTPIPPTSTATSIPSTATSTGTAVSMCLQLSAGSIEKTGNTMRLAIKNPNSYPITINNIFVIWNGNRGHDGQGAGGSGDDTLDLRSASLGSTAFWSGDINGASSVTLRETDFLNTAVLPGNFTNLYLTFSFHQTYDNWIVGGGTPEQITITFNQPTGCTLNVLTQTR